VESVACAIWKADYNKTSRARRANMISAETVTQTWQRMSDMPEDQAQHIVGQMSKEQPFILAYLLAMSEQPPLDEHEGQIFFYLGMVVWQIMKQSPKRLRKVTRTKLERSEKANERFLEMLASDTEADFFSATKTMLEHYLEPEVLGYVIETLMDEEDYDPDDPPIRDENRGLAFLHLKIVLDAFIGSIDR
jgi:hypothetical protein